MSFKSIFLAAVAAVFTAVPAFAQDIMIGDAYARSSFPGAKTGAVFMMLQNHGAQDDRLIAASSPAAARVELHTHIAGADGVMKMREVEDGFVVPATGMHALQRGGDHVMLMGLNAPLVQDEAITLTLTFEKAGNIELIVPVDSERAAQEAPMGHGAQGHAEGGMKHGN